MTGPDRCQAAHPDDPTTCEGDRQAVRVEDQAGAHVLGCVYHAARLYASLVRPRVYPEQGHGGAALDVYTRALTTPPFAWMREAGG